jgi:hypothetical protein
VQIRFFVTVLQQVARADPMTALLSQAVGGSMQSQVEAKLVSMNLKSPVLKSSMPSSTSARTFNTSATNRQWLAFNSSSSFLSPGSANSDPNPSDAAVTLALQCAKLKAASNAAHRRSGSNHERRRARYMGRRQFTRLGRGARTPHTRHFCRAWVFPSTEHRLLWPLR